MADQQTKPQQPQPQTPAPIDAGTAVAQFNAREPGKMMMRNVMTGEVLPAERTGVDTYGRNLYKPRPGHEPVGNHTVAEDGSWVEITPVPTALDRSHNVQGMSGSKATLGAPPETAQQARQSALHSAQHPDETGLDADVNPGTRVVEPQSAATRAGRPGR